MVVVTAAFAAALLFGTFASAVFCAFAVAFFSTFTTAVLGTFAVAFFSAFAVTFFCTFASAVLSAFAAAFFIVFDGIKIKCAGITFIGATGDGLWIAAHTGFAAAFSEKSKKRKRHKRENKEFFHVTP